MTFKLTEHQIQDQIIGYLRMKGYYVQRLNSGKYAMGEGRSKRFVQGVAAGTPDVMAFKPNCPEEITGCGDVDILFIEVKRPKNKPTPLQVAKMEELEEYGARCLVATSIEDLLKEGI